MPVQLLLISCQSVEFETGRSCATKMTTQLELSPQILYPSSLTTLPEASCHTVECTRLMLTCRNSERHDPAKACALLEAASRMPRGSERRVAGLFSDFVAFLDTLGITDT